MTLTATQVRGVTGAVSITDKGTLQYTAEVPYIVGGVTSLTIGVHEVLAATGLPAVGSKGHGGYCLGYRTEQPKDATANSAWTVTAQFGKWPDVSGMGEPEIIPGDPTLRPPVVTRRLIEREETVDHDADGKPIVNTAGDPFDPGLTDSKYRLAITVQRFVLPTDALGDNMKLYAGKVNNDAVGTYQPGELCIRDIQEVITYEGIDEEGSPYRVVDQTISLEADPDQWITEVLNRGPRHYEDVGGTTYLVAVKDDYGVTTGENVLLDQQGYKLATGAQPHYVPFQLKEPTAFAPLNLGSLFV